MKIRLIPAAKTDMFRIWAYYEKKQPGLGDDFLDELGAAVRLVRDFPSAPPEFWKGTRRVLLKRFPYGAAYRISGDEIQLIVIAHLCVECPKSTSSLYAFCGNNLVLGGRLQPVVRRQPLLNFLLVSDH